MTQLSARTAAMKCISNELISKLCSDAAFRHSVANQHMNTVALQLQESFLPELLYYTENSARLFQGLAFYHLAKSRQEKGEHGPAIALFQLAAERISSIKRSSFSLPSLTPFYALVDSHKSIVSLALARAISENDTIYFDRVPPTASLDSLPEPKSISKSISFVPPAPSPLTLTLVSTSRCFLM